jgi:hypothetical protein
MEDHIELNPFDGRKLRETKRILSQFDSFYAKPQKTEMPTVVIKTIEKALKDLRSAGCAYQVMGMNNEMFLHKAEVFNPAKEKKRNRKFSSGELKKHYMPYIENLQEGDVAIIPATENYSVVDIQHSITATMCHLWGNGSYTTCLNRKNNTVEVLRK